MKKATRFLVGAAIASLFGGCAQVPDVTLGYYLAKTKVSFRVIRTVGCDTMNNPIVANSTTPTIAHSADLNQFVAIPLVKFRGPFSDTDVKFDYYEDGRLKSVNATTQGQGEAILKTVVTIATAAVGLDRSTKKYPRECAFLKDAGGGKPLTLTYEGEVDIGRKPDEQQIIPPDTTSGVYAETLAGAIGGVCAFVEGTENVRAPLAYAIAPSEIRLQAKQPGVVKIKVMAGPADGCQSDTVWYGRLPAAQLGTSYEIPIPPAPMFGKQVFAISFLESGALAGLQYASTPGMGQALNVTAAALTALEGETAAQKAAAVKAEADLIAQQQRLVQCLADRTACK